MNMINFIVELHTMCHRDEKVVTELGNNERLHKYTMHFKSYIFANT